MKRFWSRIVAVSTIVFLDAAAPAGSDAVNDEETPAKPSAKRIAWLR